MAKLNKNHQLDELRKSLSDYSAMQEMRLLSRDRAKAQPKKFADKIGWDTSGREAQDLDKELTSFFDDLDTKLY
jgi:glycine cleavage system regulatory protein